jgi:hypothetical protein
MSKPRSRRIPPSRRQKSKAVVLPDEARELAASEVTEKLEQINVSQARTLRQSPESGVAGPPEARPGPLGAAIVDCRLFSHSADAVSAEVISVTASPDSEASDRVVIRIDGWEGHLRLTLPRDRAALLVKKLEHALDACRSRIPRAARPPAETSPDLPTVVLPEINKIREKQHSRRAHRRMSEKQKAATDQVLDELTNSGPHKGTKIDD